MVGNYPIGNEVPSPEEIEANDAIDEDPAEYYARRAAEESSRAADDASHVRYQRDWEYKLIYAAFAVYGALKAVEAVSDARL